MPSLDQNHFLMEAMSFPVNKFLSLDSTNLYLKSHLTQYPDFSVIVTENQLGGRGRFDRKWQSASGRSLTCSIKIPLDIISQQCWSNITQVMALSVALLLEDFGLCPQIKWPNDILVSNEKICGILAEAIPLESGTWMILGVGLNINEEKSDFLNLNRAATSLLIQLGKPFDIDDILRKLLSVFKRCFSRFASSGFGDLVGMISDRLYKPDALVQVIQGNSIFKGRISGITERGTVLIETETGTVEVVSGEITSITSQNAF